MNLFEQLAEARIREWQEKGSPLGLGAEGVDAAPSLEVQLLREALAARLAAEACVDPGEAAILAARARDLRTQLLVLLERSGRPLAARQVEAMLTQLG